MQLGVLIIFSAFLLYPKYIVAQDVDSLKHFSGIVYDERFNPLPYTHVLALGSGAGDVSDGLGAFDLKICPTDTLIFYNITCQDTAILVSQKMEYFYVLLKQKVYALNGVKIFEWGSSYQDMVQAFSEIPDSISLGNKLGLPSINPDYVPYDLDEKKIKSAGFLITSPLSYFYHNFSRYEINRRKAFQLERNETRIHKFDELLSVENISNITGFEGDTLTHFMLYMNQHMQCDYRCKELDIITEVHLILEEYNASSIDD
jgi:hypothetical protein